MALQIYENKCIGCGVCSSMLDDVFEMDDNKGVAIVKNAGGASDSEIEEAIEACPVEAISL